MAAADRLIHHGISSKLQEKVTERKHQKQSPSSQLINNSKAARVVDAYRPK
ncbi:hypothetical protein POX09_20485 [Enterobacter roggenkampii]